MGTQVSDTGFTIYDNHDRKHIHAFEEKTNIENFDCGVVCSGFYY